MEKLVFKTTIAASLQQVWNTMLHPQTYKEWTGVSWPGSYYEGRWEAGENLRFISPGGSGTLARLVEHRPYAFSKAKHIAILKGGVEDRDSKEAKAWIGTTESYTFTETAGGTELKVEIDTRPDFAGMFTADFPKSLAKLKELCER
jgi:uncharacterized protein YndB with AHSA1/START domain